MISLTEVRAKVGRRLWTYTPKGRRIRRENHEARMRGLALLEAFSRGEETPRFERALVDGQWDNANYWIRYALVRRALGLSCAHETGLVGQYNRERAAEAFSSFGFDDVADYGQRIACRAAFGDAARAFLGATHRAHDIHGWTLPGGLPGTIVHDGILKRQRRGDVDLRDPKLPSMVAEALAAIDAAERVIDETRPDLLVLSHMIDFSYAALAWTAASRGIPVLVLYGNYGINRFTRLYQREDIYSSPSRPTDDDAAAIGPQMKDSLSAIGRKAMEDRLGGNTADVAVIYAYRRRQGSIDRDALTAMFRWDPAKPVIGVYAPNWFDYPNGFGRFPFCDFREWAEATLDVACRNGNVNWLFKAHPCDEWYGTIRGNRIADMVAARKSPHVQICDASWNGMDVLNTLDGVVTVHGTVGLEAAMLGKPVLVPYPGWYGRFSFVTVAKSAAHYFDCLTGPWWEGVDRLDAARRSCEFAGWCYAAPDWHGDWFLLDDANQDAIWWDIEKEFKRCAGAIAREVDEIGAWFTDGHRYFDIFKLRRSDSVVMAHPRSLNDSVAGEDPRRVQLLSKAKQ
jgi:hypothetical protein